MKIHPVLTEKSTQMVKSGFYTFWVDSEANKNQIRNHLEKVFNVHIIKIRTISYRGLKKRNYKGYIQKVRGRKKAIVRLKKDESIDLFEEKKLAKGKSKIS